ncbi:MAG TPA: elongation factor P, partial [Bacilli bacterium]|nr:elongation factor P [Bacilli bacterium]
KLKNLKTGSITEDTYNTNIKIEKAHIDKKKMQYLYSTGKDYIFMDNDTYDQISIPENILKEEIKYLKENIELNISYYNGEIIGIDLPEKVEYLVTETSAAVRGNTTSNAMKDATIETGYTLRVPLFISEGDVIIVSTKDGKYNSRA